MTGEVIEPSTARRWLLSTQRAAEDTSGDLYLREADDDITLAGLYIANSAERCSLLDVYHAICRQRDVDAQILPHVVNEMAHEIVKAYSGDEPLRITDGFASS